MADSVKTDNAYLRSMSKKVGNVDDGKIHTDNYYLKRIEAKIGQGGGGYDDTDLKEKMGYDDIPVGENLQGQITDLADTVGDLDIPVDVSDLTDTQNTPFTPKAHTHSESDITDLGDYISKSNTDGLVKNDGTIDTNSYSQSGHTHLMADITDLTLPAAVKVVTVLPTASVDTMDKLFILVGNDTVDVYYTTKSGNTYSWHKMDDDILDNLSIDWSDVQNKPSTFTPSAHTHTENDITNLGDYIEKSNTAGLVKNDGTIDTTQYVSDVSGKADVADFDTIEATITYMDTTTETVEFYIVPRT